MSWTALAQAAMRFAIAEGTKVPLSDARQRIAATG
jgi:hypothetical protein